jgi:hypothetical protein
LKLVDLGIVGGGQRLRAEAKTMRKTKSRKAHLKQAEAEQLFGEMEQELEEVLQRKKRKPA